MTEPAHVTRTFDKEDVPPEYDVDQTIAYVMGSCARQYNFSNDYNPWKAGTLLGLAWIRGWSGPE